MLAVHAQQSASSAGIGHESRSNVASWQARQAFILTPAVRRNSRASLRREARKYVVRDAIGYGRCPEGKRLVVACAWGIAPQMLDRLLSPSHPQAITDARLLDIPEPQRSQVLAMERWFDTLDDDALAAWVAARRPMRRVA